MMYRKIFHAALLSMVIAANCVAATATQPSPVGNIVHEFSLKDFRGKSHSLSDFQQHKILVIAFLGTECPLAKLYAPRLNELTSEFESKGVGFIGINSNTQDSITEIAAYARIHKLSFPILKDVGNQVADQLQAVRTPEVFVLDQDRRIRYWGRIDDQYGVGYIREKPQRQDLRETLNELLDGKDVSTPVAVAAGCYIGRIPKAKSDANASEITYSKQVSRILQQRCVQCHREGDIAPFSLTDYDEVVGWAETIEEVIRDQRMPPWHANPEFGHFSNDRNLSDQERETVFEWVAAGAPLGDPRDLPKPRRFVEGWQLPEEPDKVVYMSDDPIEVAAEGTVRYKYFRVPAGFKTDKWIKAVEAMPGNRAVVHHILVFVDASEGDLRRDFGGGVRGFLAGYVPGLRSIPFPDGMAKFIPAGSSLVFQMHYTPIGSVQQDRSKIGFVFADPDEIKYEVKTVSAFQPFIRIPKNTDDHQEVSKTRISQPAKLLALMPHMHLRGKAFTYLARLPGQDDWTTLLDVPRYDFNWQTNYRLTEPMDLPRDTYIKCISRFDNSSDNLNNPDPGKTVRWGEQTWDEMMIGYFDIAVPVDPNNLQPAGSGVAEGRWEELLLQLDKDDDNLVARSELPARMRLFAGRADKNKDGHLDMDELKALVQRRR